MFLAIEGLDGVGKSTITKSLASKIEATVYKPRISSELATQSSLLAHYFLYLLANYQVGKKARRIKHYAISDSHVLRTITVHEAMGINSSVLHLTIPLLGVIPKPDLNYLLTCDHQQRLSRLQSRSKPVDKFDVTESYMADRVIESYQKWGSLLSYEIHQLDTTLQPPDQIVALILHSLASQ